MHSYTPTLARLTSSTVFFFVNHSAATVIYTLSLHDALPISAAEGLSLAGPTAPRASPGPCGPLYVPGSATVAAYRIDSAPPRSEEHTSELQSRRDLVCRLLLEKKKIKTI